ncbi:hypothetical protein FGADI_9718 [Fusarium gaditjirri]|uniref:Uncharacterized protein n=1 Tax=Fusarium gaditjirri TaxID=282569 RepID=A0A8H4SZ08_9HYPO|nr:hypothetical protein FGADI_9718 [Fusarium gaditjirri]
MFFKAIINASAIAGLAAAVPFSTNTTSACPTLCVDAINDCGVICYPICSPELYPTPPSCTPTTATITPITPTPNYITNSTL